MTIGVFLALMAFAAPAEAASRYWVGGGASANWDATANTNWSATSGGANNASVPGSTDDVFFDGVGGGASNSTLSAAITIRSLNMTGYANTLTHNAAVTLSIGDATAGASNVALTMVSGMTYTLGNVTTSAISFISTSTTVQTVNFAGKTTGNVTYNGVAGSWQMTGTHNTGTTATVTLTNGTLDTNGQTMSIGLFNSSNANTRVLTLGASAITISGGTGTDWNTATTTGLTFNANTSTITLSGNNQTFAGGGLTFNNVTTTGGNDRFQGANTFANLTLTGTISKGDAYAFDASQTITGTLTINGNSANTRPLIRSITLGTAITLTAATVTVTNADFRDITGAGAGSWNLSAITGNSGDAGGNSGITFTTAAAQTWSGTSGGNWSANAWTSRVPLPQDDVVINAAFSASQTVTADMPRLGKSIDFTGATGTPTFAINSTANTIHGSLTLISGMNLTTGSTPVFEGRGLFTLTTGGKTFASVTMQMIGGTLTLQDNFSAGTANTFTLTNGTFDANGKNVTVGLFSSTNANTRTITMGTGTWTLTGNAAVIWTTATSTGLTLNRGSNIVSNYSGATGTRTISAGNTAGGAEAVSIPFSFTAGTDTVAFSSTSRIHNLDFTGFAGTFTNNNFTIYGNLTISTGMTVTAGASIMTFAATSGTQSITSNAKTLDLPLTFNGVGGTFQLADALTVGSTRTVTLVNGTLNANNNNFTMGLFSSANTNTRTLTMGTGTWTLASTGTVWDTSTTTGLTFSGSSATIKLTNSSATARTITAGSLASFSSIWVSAGTDTPVLTNVTNCVDLNFTGFTGTGPTFPDTINGSLTLVSGMTMPAASATAITFGATSGTKTITSASQTIDRPLTFNGVGGTWQLADALTVGSTRTVTLTNGTFNANNQNISTGAFSSSNSNTRTITMGSGTWTLSGNNVSPGTPWQTTTTTGLTLNANTSTISFTDTSATAKSFSGGGLTFNNLSITGGGTGQVGLSGANTFNNVTINAPKTFTFPASSTTTLTGTLTATGSSGNVITINSSTSGTAATLSKSSGRVCGDYLSLQDSTATGGAAFYAGANSTNVSGNTGWTFSACPGGALEIGGD